MLRKTEIKKLATKLGWEINETEYAIKELLDSSSIINCEEFLKVCIKSNNSSERLNKVHDFLLKTLKGDLAKIVCDLLYIDPCFQTLAVFNAYDLSKSKKLELFPDPKIWAHPKIENKTFYKFKMIHPTENGKPVFSYKDSHYIDYRSMSYKFIDLLITNRLSNRLDEMVDLMSEVVGQTGFLAFNVFSFITSVTFLSEFDRHGNDLKKLVSAFNDPFMNRNEITENKHWLIYALVESLRKEGYGLRESFKKAGQLLKLGKPSSIQPRYFERKKEAKKKELSLNDIIKKYRLNRAITELLLNES